MRNLDRRDRVMAQMLQEPDEVGRRVGFKDLREMHGIWIRDLIHEEVRRYTRIKIPNNTGSFFVRKIWEAFRSPPKPTSAKGLSARKRTLIRTRTAESQS